MNRSAYRRLLPLVILAICGYSISQVANVKGFDPLQQLVKAFPNTVEIKNHSSLLEFCPDGTCDGFVTSGSVPLPTLKDFAYLYTYFFSDNLTLDDWKATEGAKEMPIVFLAKANISRARMRTAAKRHAAFYAISVAMAESD